MLQMIDEAATVETSHGSLVKAAQSLFPALS
jgi:hypothetical protein